MKGGGSRGVGDHQKKDSPHPSKDHPRTQQLE